jgi:hypothetical protein
MLSVIKLAKGDGLELEAHRVVLAFHNHLGAALRFDEEEVRFLNQQQTLLYKIDFQKTQTRYVTMKLLENRGVGRRRVFEVSAPDDVKIKISRWWKGSK